MGVTRSTVVELARDLGIPVEVGTIRADLLVSADELFFSGTAAEVTPILEVDGRSIGSGEVGPVTRRIQGAFFDAARGKLRRYREWLSFASQPKSIPL